MKLIKYTIIASMILSSTAVQAFKVENPFNSPQMKSAVKAKQPPIFDSENINKSQSFNKTTNSIKTNEEISDLESLNSILDKRSLIFESFTLDRDDLIPNTKKGICFLNAKEVIDVYRTAQYDLETALKMMDNTSIWKSSSYESRVKIVSNIKSFSVMEMGEYEVNLNKLTNKLRSECNKK